MLLFTLQQSYIKYLTLISTGDSIRLIPVRIKLTERKYQQEQAKF